MRPLDGRQVALLESRRSEELAQLIRRLGGVPIAAPSVREVLRQDNLTPVLDRLQRGEFDLLVILTAVACEMLFAAAERAGILDEVIRSVKRMTVVCRGPKPLVALRRRQIDVRLVTDKPHTTDDLRTALEPVELAGKRVLLLHHGERSSEFAASLRDRGAVVQDLSLYEWALPEDVGPLRDLVERALGGRVDAVLFTSQVQFRHLLQVARDMGSEAELTRILRDEVVVGSIGPVCSRVLRAAGIVPDVMPHAPNGPSLIQAVAEYFSVFGSAGESP